MIWYNIQPLAIELKICLAAMFVNFLSNETNLYIESDPHRNAGPVLEFREIYFNGMERILSS